MLEYRNREQNPWMNYGSAMGSIFATTMICLFLDPILQRGHLHYLLYVVTLIFTAWHVGFRPCLLAMILSYPPILYFFTEPRFTLWGLKSNDLYGLMIYTFLAGLVLAYTSRLSEILLRQEAERRLMIHHEVTSILASSADLSQAMTSILQLLCESFHWDVGLFWSPDSHSALYCANEWHRSEESLEPFLNHSHELRYAKGRGLPGKVWETMKPGLIPDLGSEALPRSAVARQVGLHANLGFPISIGAELLGIMEFVAKKRDVQLKDLAHLMSSIGRQIGQYTEHHELELQVREQQHDQRLAQTIQQSLLPKLDNSPHGFQIKGRSIEARTVGGDYYDLILSHDPNRPTIIIGDASGHGMAAALVISTTHAYIRAFASSDADLGKILECTNRCLTDDLESGRFVTLCAVQLNRVANTLVYANAGHCPGVLLDVHGKIKHRLDRASMPLGTLQETRYTQSSTVSLAPGDLIVLYTDGIVEARSLDGTMFGYKRMVEIIQTHHRESLDFILDAVFASVKDCIAPQELQDDMTMLLVKVDETGSAH